MKHYLLPCPFCGETPKLSVQVKCNTCDVTASWLIISEQLGGGGDWGKEADQELVAKAVENWNKKVITTGLGC